MTESLLERAVAILGDVPRFSVPVDDLARRLGTGDPDSLARTLARDPRVAVIEPPAPLAPAPVSMDRRAAYERAFQAAGLREVRRVALVRRSPPTDHADVADLLCHTASLLLAHAQDGSNPAIADAAERTHPVIRAAVRSGA